MHLDTTRHSMTLCSRCTPFLISSCLSSKLISSPAVTLASTRPWLDSRGAYFSSNTCPQSQPSGASKCGRCAMLPLAIVSPLTFTWAMQVARTWRWVSDTKLWTNWLQSTTTKTATCTSTASLHLSPWCNTCHRMGHMLVRQWWQHAKDCLTKCDGPSWRSKESCSSRKVPWWQLSTRTSAKFTYSATISHQVWWWSTGKPHPTSSGVTRRTWVALTSLTSIRRITPSAITTRSGGAVYFIPSWTYA